MVFGGLSALIRRQNWQWLGLPATLAAYAWVGLWLADGLAVHDGAALSLFLFGVAAVTALVGRTSHPSDAVSLWLRYLGSVGSLVLMAAVTYETNFGAFEWAMFGLLASGAILLAWFDEHTYAPIPWLALGASIAMLLGWNQAHSGVLSAVIIAFALLFATSSQYLLSRSRMPLSWAGLSVASTLAFFVVAYTRLDGALHRSMAGGADAVWAFLAMILAGLLTLAVTRKFVTQSDIRLRHQLQAIFAAAATTLISMGLAILLHREFLPLAISAEIFAISWIALRVDLPALRVLAQVLCALYGALVLPEFVSLLDWVPLGPFETGQRWQSAADVTYHLAIPGILIGVASILNRSVRDDEFVTVLETGAIVLTAVAIFKFVHIGFSGSASSAALLVRSIGNDCLLAFAAIILPIANAVGRRAPALVAVVISCFVLVRIVCFDFVLENPLWSHQIVGAWPLFNALLLAYALPAMATIVIARQYSGRESETFSWASEIAAFVLFFAYLSLNVRQVFSGTDLGAVAIGSAEVYSYSALWLACGVALLFVAVLRKDVVMRIVSLVVLLLTVGKVFLYDASALGGLWRVVSFLGLGLCLLALSWFYSRFVFTTADASSR